MRALVRDIYFSLRLLRRRPMETALAVTALALGIGLSTAMFSVLWGTVLRGLPYAGSARLVRLETISQGEKVTPTEKDFLAWRSRQRSFEGLASFLGTSFNLSSTGLPAVRCNGAWISSETFKLVQVRPLLGRELRAEDEKPGAPVVAILSFELWRDRFGSDSAIIGKVVKLDSDPAVVIAVMPAGFGFPLHQEIWSSLQFDPSLQQPRRVQVFGKLKPGAARRQAAAELLATAAPFAGKNTVTGVRVTPYVDAYTEDLQPTLYLLLGASLGLLLVVCANVSGLLTAQTLARLPELAVRSAMGATRARLLAQLTTEAALLTLAATLFSLPLAEAAIRLYLASQGGELPSFWMDVRLDGPSLAYALVTAIFVSSISAVIPSLQATGRSLNEVLKRRAGRGAVRSPGAGSGLRLAVQLALSFTLLSGTGLLIASVERMGRLNFGSEAEKVLTAQVMAPYATYPTAAERVRFFHAVVQQLEAALGQGHVAVTSAIPGGATDSAEVEIEGRPQPLDNSSPQVFYLTVSPEYFRVLRVGALQGRLFDSRDSAEGQPAVVVNQSFIRRYLGDRPDVGAGLRFITANGRGKWRTIVGIIPDMAVGLPPAAHAPAVYLAFDQAPTSWASVILRTPGNTKGFAKVLQKTVAAIDPEVPVFWFATLQERLDETRQPLKTMSEVFLAFGAVSLFLSLLGIYGVTAQSVISRSGEMAIRLALGGQKRDLLGLVMRSTLFQIGSGMISGVLFSFLVSRYLASFLFEVRAWEPGVFVIVGLLMSLAGLLASFLPARRVLGADPAAVLQGN